MSPKNKHAVALGRLGGKAGGKKGGKARAKALSGKRRSEIARKAARARWDKVRLRKAISRVTGQAIAEHPEVLKALGLT